MKLYPTFAAVTRQVLPPFLCALFVAASAPAQPVPPSSVMPPIRYVSVYGQRIAYYELGEGKTLVLLHGLGVSAAIDWAQVIRQLSLHYRVIAVDMIGFGNSDKPNIDYTSQTFVDFLAGFLQDLGVKHFYLAGESMGGGIVALYAAESAQPDSDLPKVDKAIITDGAVFNPNSPPPPSTRNVPASLIYVPSTVKDYRDSLVKVLFTNHPSYASDAYSRDVYQLLMGYHSASTIQAMIARPGVSLDSDYIHQHLKDINIPTLIIWGKEDGVIPSIQGDYIHSVITDSKYVVIPDCGHAPAIEMPNAYLREVLAFLGE